MLPITLFFIFIFSEFCYICFTDSEHNVCVHNESKEKKQAWQNYYFMYMSVHPTTLEGVLKIKICNCKMLCGNLSCVK